MKAIKIGDLREESNRLGREITAMQKQKKAVDIMIEVYAPARAARKARVAASPVVAAPAPAPLPVTPPPVVPKIKPLNRPTGKLILEALSKTPGSCMTRPQIAAAIGYSWGDSRDKALIVASVSGMVTAGKLKINTLGLYCLGGNA